MALRVYEFHLSTKATFVKLIKRVVPRHNEFNNFSLKGELSIIVLTNWRESYIQYIKLAALKNYPFLALTLLFLFLFNFSKSQENKIRQKPGHCGSMKALETWRVKNPSRVQANKNAVNGILRNLDNNLRERLQAIVNIPVVFHIVLPNPYIVTDADIMAQINRLNLDYSGLNPDSTNIPNDFQAVRGHSQLRFVLAKRTPAGQSTNGIERKASSTQYDVFAATDPIKRAAAGGLDAWDASQYLNIWIGTGGDILGYSTFPGTAAPADQGVVIDLTGTSNNPCYVDTDYNMGRTLTHETGHFFGLYHIWGDDTGCSLSDFDNLPGTFVISDPTLAGAATDQTIGDTPNQGDENFGCNSGTVSNSCGNASGDMYQNFMDYTNDACMTMFTKKQAERMEWVVANFLTGFLTSQGGVPLAGANNWDAAPLNAINPGGFEINNCTTTSYTDVFSCSGHITPKFLVTNNGANTITSLLVGYRFNNDAPILKTINVNIPSGGSYVASFSPFIVPVGNHTFKFFTAAPNGNTDQVQVNDTLVKAFQVLAPITVPVFEAFESASPFNHFIVDNPNGDATWERTAPGRNGSTGKLSIDNFNNDTKGTVDDLRSVAIAVDPTLFYTLSFDLAHRYYPNALFNDTLSVLISGDCGQTFTTIYKKWGASLATAGSYSDAYTSPESPDWRTESLSLNGPLLSSGQIIIVFRNSGKYGNIIHLDNINLSRIGGRDLRVVSINAPGSTSCSPSILPSVTLINEGSEEVSSFKIGYRFDNAANTLTSFNQTLAAGETKTFSLPSGVIGSGSHSIIVFTADPVSVSGIGDDRLSNDTLSKTFSLVNLINSPVVESFETAFPPSGWTILNPNNNVTWVRKAPGRNSQYSVFFDNYNNNIASQEDELRVPFLNITGADSVIISFDVAHKSYPGSNDSLIVLSTNDCGNTFNTIYNKGGASLATGGSTTEDYQTPVETDWKTERISLGGSVLSNGSIGISFKNKSDFGNNIFLDNINVSALFKRDLQVVSINQPGSVVCASSITPNITVRNNGSEMITAFNVSYTVNGSSIQTHSVAGINLLRNKEMTISLPSFLIAGQGSYNLQIYSWEPITNSGAGDLSRINDTLRTTFSVPGTMDAPFTETFTSSVFPPANWSVLNSDGGITWTRNDKGNGTIGSAYVNTFNYPLNGQKDDLAMPIARYGNVDSIHLNFDLSAATYSYPGTTSIPIDTLEVLVTKDCGNTFATVYKKWGYELQSISDPNTPQSAEFFPASSNQWRRERIDLTNYVNQSPVMVVFRVVNNYENNIFIDNIEFKTTTLPNQLKQQGYMILPTAFQNDFRIWHYQAPTTLKSIQILNSGGQLVWSKQYAGYADRQITVDLASKAAGVYFVEMYYSNSDKKVVQKVVKY